MTFIHEAIERAWPPSHRPTPHASITRRNIYPPAPLPSADDSVLSEFDTLVVNSGAHILRRGMRAYESRMSDASASLTESMRRLHGDDAILVVRNTSPGHWNCEAM